MPATHRLDVILVPAADLDPEPIAARALAALQAGGFVDGGGGPGPRAGDLLPGGFARARLDLPPGPTLYANQQGGFRAACPACGANVVPVLGRALVALRDGRAATVTCPACGVGSDLDALAYRPAAAVGRFAVILADAGGSEPGAAGLDVVRAQIGPVRVVLRRPAWCATRGGVW